MANILGSLFVDLRANTAEFVTGMSRAGAHAQKTGKEIEHSFSSLGNVLSNVLGPLGNIGQQISTMASGIGDAVGGTMREASKLSTAMTAVGVAGVAGFGLAATGAIELANHAAEMGSKIFEASEVTGLSASNLSGLAAVSKLTGESFDTLSDSLARAGKNLHQALLEPGEVTAKVLAGIMGGSKDLAELGLKPLDESLQIVLQRIFSLNNVGERNLALNALLGRGWLTNVETLKMLAEQGYGPAIAQAKKLGMYFDDASARQAKQYTVEMAAMKGEVAALGLAIGQDLIPYLTEWMQALQGIGARLQSWGYALKALLVPTTAQQSWAAYKKSVQAVVQAQTDFLVQTQAITDASKKGSDAALNLGAAHVKLPRTSHAHAAAVRDLDRAYTDLVPHLLTVDEELQRMAASDYEEKIRAMAQAIRDTQAGIMPKALTAGGVPRGPAAGTLMPGAMDVPTAPVMTQLQILQQQFRSFFADIEAQGKGFGDKVFGSLSQAMDGVSSQLAHLVVTGKSSFHELFAGLQEEIMKAGIQKMFGQITAAVIGAPAKGSAPGQGGEPAQGESTGGFKGGLAGVLGHIFGGAKQSTQPGASPSNPLYTSDVSSQGGAGGAAPALAGGILSKLLKSKSDSDSGDGGDGDGGDGGDGDGDGGGGGGFSSIFAMFKGLARGGDVTPGKAYIVGEHHPEFFVPKQPGHIAPSVQLGSPQQTVVNFAVNGVNDFDSFKHSNGQVMSMLQNQMASAHARNH